MIRRVCSALAIFAASLLLACVADAPTATTPTQSAPSLVAAKTPTPTVSSTIDVGWEVRRLFDTWARAFRAHDAKLLHSTLNQRLLELCRLEDMQAWIEELGPRMPALEVAAVFVDVDNANRGWAELRIGSAGDGGGDEYYPLVPFSGFLLILLIWKTGIGALGSRYCQVSPKPAPLPDRNTPPPEKSRFSRHSRHGLHRLGINLRSRAGPAL